MQYDSDHTSSSHDAVASTISAYSRLFEDAQDWSASEGVPIDLDVFALAAAAALHWHPGVCVTFWGRVRVACTLWMIPDFCAAKGIEVPDHYPQELWKFLCFLSESDWLDDRSDRLDALLQPLQCEMGLDKYGEPTGTPGSGPKCLCFQQFRGRSHGWIQERAER